MNCFKHYDSDYVIRNKINKLLWHEIENSVQERKSPWKSFLAIS